MRVSKNPFFFVGQFFIVRHRNGSSKPFHGMLLHDFVKLSKESLFLIFRPIPINLVVRIGKVCHVKEYGFVVTVNFTPFWQNVSIQNLLPFLLELYPLPVSADAARDSIDARLVLIRLVIALVKVCCISHEYHHEDNRRSLFPLPLDYADERMQVEGAVLTGEADAGA